MLKSRSLRTAIGTIVVALVAVVVPSAAPASAASYEPTPVAGLQINGIVRAVEVSGTTAYIGGAFTSVTGSNGTFARNNIVAINLVDRSVSTTFAPSLNAAVYAIKSVGTTVYAGGDFVTVNGVPRKRLAALTLTGGLVPTFTRGEPSNRVRTIEIAGSQLWIGGGFDYVSGQPRSAVATLNPATGAVLPIIVNADKSVRSIKANADGSRVFIGGDFALLAGQTRNFLGSVDTASGLLTSQTFPSLLSAGDNLVLALDYDPTTDRLFGGVGGVKGVGLGNQVVAWDAATGAVRWSVITDGDVQAVDAYEGNVYFGFHEGFGGDLNLRLLSANATTGALDNSFKPTVNSFFGVWAVAASPVGLVAGGEFTQVNGVPTGRAAIFPISTRTPVTLIPAGQQWKYSDVGPLADGWQSEAFNDSAWLSGAAQLGYGDGDEATVIRFGPSTTKKHVTSYFRTTFDAGSNIAAYENLFINLLADDGAVVYVNGVEVARDNMPAGAITSATFAASTRDGAYESAYRPFALNTALLKPGINTIAVEVHQVTAGSSDLSFALSIDGVRR